MAKKGRLAGDNPVVVVEQRQVDPQPLQSIQSLSLAGQPNQQVAERTPYSPFGKYPVSDGLIDFGEPTSIYR